MKEQPIFTHTKRLHNLDSPKVIVPLVLQLIEPVSVVDIGCGTGRFLKIFKENGIQDVLGIDGAWVNRQMLSENLTDQEFLECNLEHLTPTTVKRPFDLALCLEVAEHVDSRYADQLIDTLTSLSKCVLFSAAIPFQGGRNHINEQWHAYWQTKFARHDFVFWDVIRLRLWNEKNVQSWFKQNLFLVAHKDYRGLNTEFQFDLHQCYNYVHPDSFTKKAALLNDILTGRYPTLGYARLLAKSILHKTKNLFNK